MEGRCRGCGGGFFYGGGAAAHGTWLLRGRGRAAARGTGLRVGPRHSQRCRGGGGGGFFFFLMEGAEWGLEGVGDEVDVEVGWGADENHDVVLDVHGEVVVGDVAVGGVDEVADFGFGDGLHGVEVEVGGSGLDFDDVEDVGLGFLCDDVNFEVAHSPVGLAHGVSLADEEVAGCLFAFFS